MKIVILCSAMAVAGSVGISSVRIQAPSQESQNRQNVSLPIVEVIGCLSNGANSTWLLTNGSAPVLSKTPYTTVSAVKEAEAKPLGTHRYSLIGAAPFTPEALNHQKVAVKGVLIKAAQDDRINVTSLQRVSTTCARQ
jgi:hypothetical protein